MAYDYERASVGAQNLYYVAADLIGLVAEYGLPEAVAHVPGMWITPDLPRIRELWTEVYTSHHLLQFWPEYALNVLRQEIAKITPTGG